MIAVEVIRVDVVMITIASCLPWLVGSVASDAMCASGPTWCELLPVREDGHVRVTSVGVETG